MTRMPNAQSKRTHCPHGHPYAGDNLILMVVKDRDGNDTGKRKRQCRQCKRQSHSDRPYRAPRQQQAAE